MNQLQVFNNNEFGEIRTVAIGDKPHFVGIDVARSLGYKDTTNAIKQHCRWVVKHHIPHPQSKTKTIEVNCIPEGDLYRLIVNSELPSAEKFEIWVFDEVLPTIRKHGAYITNKADPQKLRDRAKEIDTIKQQEIEARLNNSRARQANILLQIAKETNINEYKEVLHSYASKIVTGEQILPLPVAERKTYSAKEIGDILGISANMVGRLANANGLKTPEYGKLFYDKSRHSDKQVETFRYYDTVIPVLEKLSKGAC